MGSTIHNIPLPKDNQFWFSITDLHSRRMNQYTFDIIIKHALIFPKHERNIILKGDFFDFAEFMPKNAGYQQWKDKANGVDEFFLPAYLSEIEWGIPIIKIIREVFNNIIWMHGNHDGPRIEAFLGSHCPEGYKPNFNIERDLKLYENKIGVVQYNDWIDFGDLSILHGQAHGPSAWRKHYMLCGARDVLFGHLHQYHVEPFHVRGYTRYATSSPCVGDLNPPWMKNTDSNWDLGYMTFCMKPTGRFNLHSHIIRDRELILSTGQVIKA